MKSKKIKVLFSYSEKIIPKRCRIARDVQFDDGKVTVSIPMVTKEEAPVAIIKNRCWDQPKPISYRWYKKQLWEVNNDIDCLPDQLHASGNGSYDFGVHLYGYQSKTKAISQIKSAAQKHLIIDGQYYRAVGEPRYVVMTFGLGANHGGTSLSWDSSYNSNIGKSRYFNLLQREEAIALATKIAKARGDNKSLPIRPEGFKVLIPDAIKVNPNKQHGNGCAFLNSLNALSESSGGNNLLVGVAAISMALQE